MTKCPKCKEDIEYLNYNSKMQVSQIYNGDNSYESMDDFGEHTDEEYRCPNCDYLITTDENQADKFLKDGKKVRA